MLLRLSFGAPAALFLFSFSFDLIYDESMNSSESMDWSASIYIVFAGSDSVMSTTSCPSSEKSLIGK